MRLVLIPYGTAGIEEAPKKIATHISKEFSVAENERQVNFKQEFMLVDEEDQESSFQNIEETLGSSAEPAVVLGGNNSISYPCFKAMKKHSQNPGMVVFDSRPDMAPGKDVNFYNYLRKMIDDGVINPAKLILVGLRNWSDEELAYLKRHNISHYTMKEISMEGKEEACDSIMSVARQWDRLYISIDVSILDPAFVPGSTFMEPGGMTPRELLYFLQRLKLLKNLAVADIVEVNTDKDNNEITTRLAAKIAVELS